MSKKGKQVDILGETHLPADLFTPTLGQNYGLDRYPDMEYGLGVLEGFKVPGTPPEAGLPDGVVVGETNVMAGDPDADPDFVESMLKEGGVQDLSWLDLNEQDFDRLPENPVDKSIPELEEAWGTERQTNGLYFFQNLDLDQAHYEDSLRENGPRYRHTAADLTRVVQRAMRRSASGHDINDILREAAEALEDEAPRVRQAMRIVKAEHGLAGNVFIRAAAYPGYEQGKWVEALKRVKSARYLIVDSQTLKNSTTIQNGYCTVTKKVAVTSVPWDEALAHYKPALEASGRRVASGRPWMTLRAAFLSAPTQLEAPAHHLPKHVPPADRISSKEARQKFQAAPAPVREVYDPLTTIDARRRAAAWRKVEAWVEAGLVPLDVAMGAVTKNLSGEEVLHRVASIIVQTRGAAAFSGLANDVRPQEITREAAAKALQGVKVPESIDVSHRPIEAKRRQAQVILARWSEAGLLAREDARRLAKSSADPLDMLRAASWLVASPEEATGYSGVENDVRIPVASREEALQDLRVAQETAREKQAQVDAIAKDRRAKSTRAAKSIEKIQSLVAGIEGAIEKGVRGQPLRDLIVRTIPKEDARVAMRFLGPLLRKTGALESEKAPVRKYEGTSYHPVEQKIATVSPREREIEAMLHWTRRSMNEGFAGSDLDSLLEMKFSKAVRKAGADQMKALRKQHEGASGFLYVEAAAYASKEGVKGCESGALKHRANQIKNVLAMGRCASCALANRLPDGSVVCQEYNKRLIRASDLPDEMPQIKKANIKQANEGDAESTASMFAPAYDPSEFDLHNEPLEGIEISAAPSTEELGEILFGGMEW